MKDTIKNICKFIEIGKVQTAVDLALLQVNGLIQLHEMIHNNTEAYKLLKDDCFKQAKELSQTSYTKKATDNLKASQSNNFFNKGKDIERKIKHYEQFVNAFIGSLNK